MKIKTQAKNVVNISKKCNHDISGYIAQHCNKTYSSFITRFCATPKNAPCFRKSMMGNSKHDQGSQQNKLQTISKSKKLTPKIEGPYQPKLDIGKVLRIFLYVPTTTKLTNAILKTQLSGLKKRCGSRLPPPQMCPLFRFWRVFSGFGRF